MAKEVLEATEGLAFTIKPKHLKKAKKGNVAYCPVATAIKEELGDEVKDVRVGTTRTIVEMKDGTVVKYRTPDKLMFSIPIYDRTGEWSADVGEFFLEPVARPTRQKQFHPRSAAIGKKKTPPTRVRVCAPGKDQ